MSRHDGYSVSQATVLLLRLLRYEDLILPAEYQRERRKFGRMCKAGFATGPNQMWQLAFSALETTTGGTERTPPAPTMMSCANGSKRAWTLAGSS